MNKTRTAVIGAGFISEFHIRALREDPAVEIVGICESDRARAQKAAQMWDVPFVCGTVDELIEKARPQIAHVVTPPPDHILTARRCMEAGVAPFIEKPVAVSGAECRLLAAIQLRTRSYVGVNHNGIFVPTFRRVVQQIQECRVGAVQHVISCLNVPLRQLSAGQHSHWMFREPRNILLEQGPHPLSQVCFLLGDILRMSVIQTGERTLNTGRSFFDTWQASFACARGTAQCYFSFGKEVPEWWLYVIGQDGAVVADFRRNIVRFCGKSRLVEPAAYAQTALGNAFAEARQGMRNFMDYGLGFLKIRPTADAFYTSLRDSVHMFHRAYRTQNEPPAALDQACHIVETCERMADVASLASLGIAANANF